ncbi:Fur family transcriptional regulator [Hoeflea poritis]|uniref:Fur family transcriptional regulator n=1 Tax=Hoeflea poritis TaxID=2993659 RepID=A0ABT4VIL9_9HYPH|nr:Fur family transcriptional regulator [Hoeflea poritis]MDA4844510.1 Fur family transcriptional regulator [Hoeflea poritis]
MTAHSHTDQPALTKNQSLVYDALTDAKAPLSAYAILDGLREHGIRAPLQVYRALDKLLELGLVHRLESLNSFVACSNSECGARETMVFAICVKCNKVSELADDRLEAHLGALAAADHFTVHAATVELRGICGQCRSDA